MKQIQSKSLEKGRMATAHGSALPVVNSTVEHKSQKGFGERWQTCKAFRLQPPFATWSHYSEKTSIHLWLWWDPQAGGAVVKYNFLSSRLACYKRQTSTVHGMRVTGEYLHTHHPFFPLHIEIQPISTAGETFAFLSHTGVLKAKNICRRGNNARYHGHKSRELAGDVHILHHRGGGCCRMSCFYVVLLVTVDCWFC